jgi:hypothetical protein
VVSDLKIQAMVRRLFTDFDRAGKIVPILSVI